MVHLVSVYDVKVDLSKYLKEVEKGEQVIITRHGKPVAQITAFVAPKITLGILAGKGHPSLEAEDFQWSDEEIAEWEKASEWDEY